MKKKIEQPAMVRKTYYLPRGLATWIHKEATKDNRSTSNFLAKLIADKMAGKK
jgi:hypothetical protein